jgi:hypothetical protein
MKSHNHSSRLERWVRRALAAVLAVAATAVPAVSAKAWTHEVSGASEAGMQLRVAETASATPAVAGSVLGGFTSQHLPSFFQISRNERELVVGSAALGMRCASGSRFLTTDEYLRVPIRANGKFKGSWVQPPTKLMNGDIVAASSFLSGRLDRRLSKLSGMWHLHLALVSPSGHSDRCDSGSVGFTALS